MLYSSTIKNTVSPILLSWMLLAVHSGAAAQSTHSQKDDSPQQVELEQIVEAGDHTRAVDGQEHHTPDEERCLPEHAVEDWIDGVRVSTHRGLCRSALWIDSRFGKKQQFKDKDFRGKLSIGFRQDEKHGFDPRLRVRIKTNLPNVSSRLNAFIGRVEDDSYISNTETDQNLVSAVGLRSNRDDDAEWLIGLGYQNPENRENGFDYSIGAKLSHGVSPYAKVTHRHLFRPSETNFWRTTQTGFWRRQDGFGVSSSLDFTKPLNDRDILEWNTTVKYTEDAGQVEWISGTTWHHSFSMSQGVSSRIYARGEEKNEVSVPEYGLTFTYVRPFLKPWLYIETGIDFRFEKEYRDNSYESVIRLGIQLQMLLGDFYGRKGMRR